MNSLLRHTEVFLHHSFWRTGEAAASRAWGAARLTLLQAKEVLEEMSQLSKGMLESDSRAMLQQAATAWKKRHSSPS